MKRNKTKFSSKKKKFAEISSNLALAIEPNYRAYLGIFFISLSVIVLEIVLTRISSLIFVYNYAFMIVSLAILGLGCGGIFSYFKYKEAKQKLTENLYEKIPFYCNLFSISVFLSIILITKAYFYNNLFLYFSVTFLPFFFVVIIVSIIFLLFPKKSFNLYFFDLLGAAAGAIIAVIILDFFGGINSVIFIGIIGFIASFLFIRFNKKLSLSYKNLIFTTVAAFIIVVIFISNFLTTFFGEIPVRKSEIKDLYLMLNDKDVKARIDESRWSAFGRTDLVSIDGDDKVKFLFIDGAAGTPMFKFNGDIKNAYKNLDFLNMIFSGTFPFSFLEDNQKDNMLIIGPGGGREVIIGLVNNVKNIIGVEINKDFVEIVKDYKQYNGGIYTDFENVKIITAEARSYISSVKEKFDIILMIQPFTKSSRSVEGYALTENYLLTTEAIGEYLDHLTNEGVLIIVLHNTNEITRFITSLLFIFEKNGINNSDAMNYFYTIGKEINPVIVVGKEPFDKFVASKIYEGVLSTGLVSTLTYIPKIGQKTVTVKMEDNTTTKINIFNEDLLAISKGNLNLKQFINKMSFNAKPATDDKPFFFKDEKGLSKNLIPLLIIIAIVNFIIIMISLFRVKNDKRMGKLVFVAVLLGFGFMMAEISFFQKLSYLILMKTLFP